VPAAQSWIEFSTVCMTSRITLRFATDRTGAQEVERVAQAGGDPLERRLTRVPPSVCSVPRKP